MSDYNFDEWLSSLDLEFFGTGQHKIEPAQLLKRWSEGEDIVVLDVRSDEEVKYIAFPFMRHIPIQELPHRYQELPEDRPIAVFCSSGARSAIAYAYLQLKGFEKVRILHAGTAEMGAVLKPGQIRALEQREVE